MSIHQPIQLPVQTFTSADTGAPQLTAAGAAGEIKTILKACLSTGYGSKAAATGWSMPFEDANKAVFKSTDPRATGFCLRIDNDKTKGGQVTCYETMTDVNTGAVQWSDAAAGFVYYMRAATNHRWRMYVTPVSFIFLTYATHGNIEYATALTFGDQLTTVSNDGGNCFAHHATQYARGVHYGAGGMIYTGYAKNAIARGASGTTGGVTLQPRGMGGTTTNSQIYNGHHGYPCYLTEANAVRLMTPWLASNKRERITAHAETLGGRTHWVTNIGGHDGGVVYFIPTDYWLL